MFRTETASLQGYVSLAEIHADETRSSLRFASRALRVTKHAHINETGLETGQNEEEEEELKEREQNEVASAEEELGEREQNEVVSKEESKTKVVDVEKLEDAEVLEGIFPICAP